MSLEISRTLHTVQSTQRDPREPKVDASAPRTAGSTSLAEPRISLARGLSRLFLFVKNDLSNRSPISGDKELSLEPGVATIKTSKAHTHTHTPRVHLEQLKNWEDSPLVPWPCDVSISQTVQEMRGDGRGGRKGNREKVGGEGQVGVGSVR